MIRILNYVLVVALFLTLPIPLANAQVISANPNPVTTSPRDWAQAYGLNLSADLRQDIEADFVILQKNIDVVKADLINQMAAGLKESAARRDDLIVRLDSKATNYDLRLNAYEKILQDNKKDLTAQIESVNHQSMGRHDEVIARMAVEKEAMEKAINLAVENLKTVAASVRQEAIESAASQKEAIAKADAANEKRFDSVNEFRGQLKDQATTLMPRSEADTHFRSISDKIDLLAAQQIAIQSRLEGAGSLWGYIIGAIGLLVAVFMAFMAFMAFQRRDINTIVSR